MSRSPRLVILLALVFPAGAPAQEIPLSGRWTLAGELVQGPAWDQDAFEAYVNECGDEITVRHPELVESLILRYGDGGYAGEAEIRAGALMKVSLTPTSERRMAGSFRVIAPEAPFPLDWEMALEFAGDGEGDPPIATHGADRTVDTKVERQGLHVTRTEMRRVEITDFPPHQSDLLPQHRDVLDWTLEKMMEDDSGVSGRYCETVESTWTGPALGYADRRLERRNHGDLARNRARNLDGYVAPRFKSQWEGTLIAGGPGAFGIEVGSNGDVDDCPRAAAAEYTTVRRYFDMYSREDTDRWLQDWLREADPEMLATEDSGDEGFLDRVGELMERDTRNTAGRRRAKSTYCAARGLLRMMEDGHCELPKHSLAEQMLMGDRMTRGGDDWLPYGSTRDEVFEAFGDAYAAANTASGRGSAIGGEDPEGAKEEMEKKESLDYQYAVVWPEECRRTADRIELDLFGDRTDWTTFKDAEGRLD